MWVAIRILRLFGKNLTRIACALEEIRDLYRLDLASRGVIATDASLRDQVEVMYGSIEDRHV